MTSRPFDPRALDVEAFAAQRGELHGEWPQRGMPRLVSDTAPDAVDVAAGRAVAWHAHGERTPPHGRLPRIWLRLALATEVTLVCQRCLGAVDVPVEVERRFGFVAGEDQAAALDAEIDDDVLAVDRALDLHDLAEDELLLALPLVPMHDDCRVPSSADPEDEPADHPFAALASLKRSAH